MSWGIRRKAGSKYGNRKETDTAGRTYDSGLEKAVFSLLSLRERAGEIRMLAHHPGTVWLQSAPRARIGYRPDFSWINCATGELEFGEAKGMETEAYLLKRKLWITGGPGTLYVWKGSKTNPRLHETIVPPKGTCPTCGKPLGGSE